MGKMISVVEISIAVFDMSSYIKSGRSVHPPPPLPGSLLSSFQVRP